MRLGARRGAKPAAIFLLLAGAAVVDGSALRPVAPGEAKSPVAPRTAPAFSRPDLDHREIRLADYRGQVVLLNFWATWCEPCMAEVPRFAQWQREYGKRGLRIVGVAMDDDAGPVKAARRKYGLDYPIVMGDEKLAEAYGGVLGLPMTFVIDGNGEIRFQHEGATDLDVIERELLQLLPRP